MPLREIALFLKRLLKRREAGLSPTTRLGRLGEDEAARHLKSKGYTILERNYGTKQGEIDLVAFRDGVLAFVEVRAQTEPSVTDPLETITRRKRRRVIQAARAYASQHHLDRQDVSLRFDVIAVLFDEQQHRRRIEHVEDAFQAPAPGLS